MKPLIIILFLCGYSPPLKAQHGWVDTLMSASSVLQDVKLRLKAETDTLSTFTRDSSAAGIFRSALTKEAKPQASANSIQLSNYYQSTQQDATSTISDFGNVPMQSTVEIRRSQAIAGVNFIVGFQGFLSNGSLDKSRSGLIFDFDHNSYLKQAAAECADWTDQLQYIDEQRQIISSARLQAAKAEVLFNDYLSTLNNLDYLKYSEDILRQSDSIRQLNVVRYTNEQDKILKQADLLRQVDIYYRKLLDRVKEHPDQFHGDAREVIDSFRRASAYALDLNAGEQILKHPDVTGVRKILLRTKTLALGNTRLPNDDFVSAGLPIKGVNYVYDATRFGFSIQHGKRITSSHFTPQDGVPYHDLDDDFRLSQLALRFGNVEGSHYKIASLIARESGIKTGRGQPAFPRKNQVFTFSGVTTLNGRFLLTTSASQAFTQLGAYGAISPAIDDGGEGSFNQLAVRAGLKYTGKEVDLDIVAFRTGANFRSFANPYLYSDYEGVECNLSAGLFNNRLYGKFSLALGGGTTSVTKDNVRWRAQGFLRYQINKRGMLSVLVSPNVYRYQVTGRESFTESSIYQLNYQQSFRVNSKELVASFGVTNLDQGWSWADSTQVEKAIILRGTNQLGLTKKISLAVDGGYRVSGADTEREGGNGKEWYVAFAPSIRGKIHFSASIRRDKYRFEPIPAWGGQFNWQMPIGKIGTLSINMFYRPARQQSATQSTVRQLQSQQHLFAKF